MWKDSVLAKEITKEQYIVSCFVLCIFVWSTFSVLHYALIDWDEGVFALQAEWFSSFGQYGKPFNFQTPPLHQLFIGLLFKIFGFHGVILRFISILFSIITIYAVFNLARLVNHAKYALYSVVLLITSELFLFFMRSGLSEAMFLCFFVLSTLAFSKGLKTRQGMFFFLSGICTTLACYTKYSAFPLLVAFTIIGIVNQKDMHKRWFLLSVVLPILLFMPYILLYLRFVGTLELGVRHLPLVGLNHHKFLIHTLIFAGLPLLLTLVTLFTYNIRGHRHMKNLSIILAVYLFFLGFYHPYFRLLYPLVPLCAVIGSQTFALFKKHDVLFVSLCAFVSLALSLPTLLYRTNIPEHIGDVADYYTHNYNIRFFYTHIPPNIDFYMPGTIAVPSTHQWHSTSTMIPFLNEKRRVITPERNELHMQDNTLYVRATALTIDNDSVLLEHATKVEEIEFRDAPVYYKDVFTPERFEPQIYQFYLFNTADLGQWSDSLWNFGFRKGVTVRIDE